MEQLHAEYARLHDQPPSTLTEDQRRSLTFYNGEMESRSAGEIPDTVPRDVANWIRNVFALEAFVRCQGRMPRENRRLPEGAISAVEKQRANSVRAQRRAFIAGRLSTYQARRLLCVPGFSFHPLEDVWQATRVAYADFTATQGAHRNFAAQTRPNGPSRGGPRKCALPTGAALCPQTGSRL
ncbi:hypothetical protein E3T24_05920 [Cryobacterium sp. TmT2-59]|nr:hypothetical protein E3T24_05920 [Cryobacterium sp. TmT2-59]